MQIIEDKENEKAIKAIKQAMSEKFQTLILCGGVGVGKTFLAKNLIQHIFFYDEPTFKQQLVSGNLRLRSPEEWGSSIKMYPLEALAKLSDMVIYDDYGTADLSPAYIEKMLFWINARLDGNKPFVITTNLSLEEFQKREARITSRLLERAIIININGPDRRKKQLLKVIQA